MEDNKTTLEITDWLNYFENTILEAQQDTLKRIDFIVEKTKFFECYKTQLNERQDRAVLRLFEAGHTGFTGGLSSKNYMKIAKTPKSTTSKDLTTKKIFIKTGELKGTRYQLNIKI